MAERKSKWFLVNYHTWRQQIRVSDALLSVASSALYVAEIDRAKILALVILLYGQCIRLSRTVYRDCSFQSYGDIVLPISKGLLEIRKDKQRPTLNKSASEFGGRENWEQKKIFELLLSHVREFWPSSSMILFILANKLKFWP